MTNACPYYKGGYCVSPLLDQPTDYVTDSSRCLGNYATCRFYPKKEETEQQVESAIINIYAAVNVLPAPVESSCEFFQLIKTQRGLVAKCTEQSRILTKSQAMLCSKHWVTCPFHQKVD